jgi:hypothetical protein
MTPATSLCRDILAILEATPRRIPLVIGDCGTGRTYTLQSVRNAVGRNGCHYVDVERTVTTPERFFRVVADSSPFRWPDASRRSNGPREAFDNVIGLLVESRTQDGGRATFVLDEVLELRTFESFPGLKGALTELMSGLSSSDNQFVLSSRYSSRASRLMAEYPDHLVAVHTAPLAMEDAREMTARLRPRVSSLSQLSGDESMASVIHGLADGRAAYASAIIEEMRQQSIPDPVAAITTLLLPNGHLAGRCRFSYELRLHRARGYGALKAILDILAEQEPLTLTEISNRLGRTPGSTKDYLSWLQDVDLVLIQKKKYSFADPLLRTWVRLHCRRTPPSPEDVDFEVKSYAASRLPEQERAEASSDSFGLPPGGFRNGA